MFDMIGEFGIFGDALMPVMKEQNKEAKSKDEKKSEKKEEKKEKVKKYKAPLTIVFDSMESLEINGDEEYTEEEVVARIQEACFLAFVGYEKSFQLTKLNESTYLFRPKPSTKYDKGDAGKYLLLEDIQILEEIIESDGSISVDQVKEYILNKYQVQTDLYLVKEVYIPIPVIEKTSSYENVKFPIRINALTLFGEQLELTKEQYRELYPQKEEQMSLLEDEQEVIPNEEALLEIAKTLLPEYGLDIQIGYNEKNNTFTVMHKQDDLVGPSKVKSKTEELYPTDASVSLIFTKIKLSSDMFEGKKEITKKELLKYIGKQYPEYSPERTELIYDKKQKLIIPSLKSGKRGAYRLEEGEDYRYENSPIMEIKAYKEKPNSNGCVGGEVIYKLPKIPFMILDEIIKFFLHIYRKQGTEAIAMIFYNKNLQIYETYYPEQRAGTGHVEFDRDPVLEHDPSKYLVMEIHSHGCFGAFWSLTDNEEELAHRLYGVIGKLDSFRYDREHIILRAATGGYHVKVDPKEVFSFKGSE